MRLKLGLLTSFIDNKDVAGKAKIPYPLSINRCNRRGGFLRIRREILLREERSRRLLPCRFGGNP